MIACSCSAKETPQAGVGIGTLYRHFPTREALFEAVYRREVEQLVELAGNPAPVATLAIATQGSSDLAAYSAERLTNAVGSLMERAVAAGEVRDDIGPEDVPRMLVALCYESSAPDWKENVLRLLDVFVDGLRRAPNS